jgi:aminoglycoside phosphotransferase (APT) family kinase protein
MHADQIDVDGDQVAGLIRDQLPDLAGQEVRPVSGGGTVNAIFRVGGGHCARFPLRRDDPQVVHSRLELEMAVGLEFLDASPFPAPRPIHIGQPGRGYPLPWLVQTWLKGDPATPTIAEASNELADDLARLIVALRASPTRGRHFSGSGRGGVLTDHDQWMAECFHESEGLTDVPALRRLWSSFRLLPRADSDVMSHTDLIPGNLLVADGRLAGVLDTGGFSAADPALDLVCAWHLLGPGPRDVLRRELGCSDLQWERGQAWAFEQAAGAFWYYRRTNPQMATMGETTLHRLLAQS